jgi:hypothetical protein
MANTSDHDDQPNDKDDDAVSSLEPGKRISLFRALWIMIGMAHKDRKKQVPSEHDDFGWFW